MPDIHIVIPDIALRNAIQEGLALANITGVQEAVDMVTALQDESVAVIILDESATDKKNLKALQEHSTGQRTWRIFLLGEAAAGWTDDLAVESFPKPLRLGHLLTRLLLCLRTQTRARKTMPVFGPWRLELQNRQIVHQENGNIVRLTEKETALLDYIAQSDVPVSREELLAAIWGHDERIDTHTLETHIYQLRRKLDPDGKGASLLVNEQGTYRLKSHPNPGDRDAWR